MPWLREVSYSREATVAAVQDYFDFLASTYISKSAILRPPEGGWPNITGGPAPPLSPLPCPARPLAHPCRPCLYWVHVVAPCR